MQYSYYFRTFKSLCIEANQNHVISDGLPYAKDYKNKYPDKFQLFLPESNIGMMQIDIETWKLCSGADKCKRKSFSVGDAGYTHRKSEWELRTGDSVGNTQTKTNGNCRV